MSDITHRTLHTEPADPARRLTRRRARQGVALYLALVAVLSGSLMTWMIVHQPVSPLWFTPLMWIPALSSIITRLVLREGFADVSFRFGGLRTLKWFGVGLAVPIGVGTVAYGSAAALGLITLQGNKWTTPHGIAVLFLVTLWVSCFSALGGEIGWRGYLLTHLIDADAPRPILLHGLVWACWHLPLIFGGLYIVSGAPWLSVGLFVVSVVAVSVVYARVRLTTGSVWPCMFLHGAWNAIIQHPFDEAAPGPAAQLWVGESGLLTVIVLVVLGVIVSRGRWTYLRSPQRSLKPATA